jgi:4-amino-4-deoxy-L-arabinose transferase-like glycosyltransferase
MAAPMKLRPTNDDPLARDGASMWTPFTVTLLAAIVLLAVGVRAAWVAYANVDPLDGRFDDTVFYLTSAQSLARDFTFRDNFGRHSAHWPPGYPLAVSAVFATFGTHLIAAKALNVAISAATVVLTYVVGARAFGVRAGMLAALLLALAPGHVYFSTLVMTEVLFAFGFLVVVALLIWWTIDAERAGWVQLLVLGAATGCLTLVRVEAMFLPFAFALLWKLALTGWRPVLRYSAILALGFVLALTPWTVRNALRFHELLPLRDNSQGALANALDRGYLDRPDRFSTPARPLRDVAGYLSRHPWEVVPLEIDKLQYLYRNDSDGVEWLQHDNRPLLTASEVRRWSRVADWYFFAVGGCALLAAPLLLRAPDRRRGVLAYMIATWTVIEIITWPETRYHLPVVPLVCMFAAWVPVRGWLSRRGG